ncbi:MAG: hypothetical protein R2881_05465 [Eubacteriales bacterium]
MDGYAVIIYGPVSETSDYEVPFVIGGQTVAPRGTWVSAFTDGWHIPKDGYEAFLDWEKLLKNLTVRSRSRRSVLPRRRTGRTKAQRRADG